jgi:hypothetical protein
MPVANLIMRFFLEVIGVAALGYLGFQIPTAAPLKFIGAIVAPAALIAVWAMVVAPNTVNGLSQPHKDIIGTAALLLVAVALGMAGQPQVAVGFALLVVVNAALLLAFGEAARGELASMSR